MKIHVTMKNPDALTDAVKEAVEGIGLDGATEEDVKESRKEHIESALSVCGRWFYHGEYLTVEIDTVAQTCKVIERV